jgi:DNA-directed RNA polymerase specialized sigma24 family protein
MDSLRCEQLWRRHADRLLLYATTVLSDRAAAEDVLQNVFVRLMASPPEDIDSEAGYLFRAVRNEALNSIRSRRLAARAFSPLFDDVAEDPARVGRAPGAREAGRAGPAPPVVRGAGSRGSQDLGRLFHSGGGGRRRGVREDFEHRYYRGLAALKEKLGGLDHE